MTVVTDRYARRIWGARRVPAFSKLLAEYYLRLLSEVDDRAHRARSLGLSEVCGLAAWLDLFMPVVAAGGVGLDQLPRDYKIFLADLDGHVEDDHPEYFPLWTEAAGAVHNRGLRDQLEAAASEVDRHLLTRGEDE